jgi:hypothetical protein
VFAIVRVQRNFSSRWIDRGGARPARARPFVVVYRGVDVRRLKDVAA